MVDGNGRLRLVKEIEGGVGKYVKPVNPGPVGGVPVAPVKVAFVPAKTIKEAEEWARANIGSGKDYLKPLRFNHADNEVSDLLNGNFTIGYDHYLQSDIDKLNSFNLMVHESNLLCDKLNIPRIRGINLTDDRSPGRAVSLGTMGDGSLAFKPILDLGNEVVIKQVTDLPKWTQTEAYLEKPDLSGQYFKTKHEGAQATFWHEFGHHIHQQVGVTSENYMKPPLEEMMTAQTGWLRFIRRTSPSVYGETNHKEWFAENFALYRMGRKDLLAKEAIEIFDELLK